MIKQREMIRLICWNVERAAELTADLKSAGFGVENRPFEQSSLKETAAAPPAAVVIDLGRMPSHGRDVGVALRTRAGTRAIPLVFIDGDVAKVAKVRGLLPDAVYADRPGMAAAVRRAITEPVLVPVVPSSGLAGYSGTPLPKKLGIKPGSQLSVVKPPADVTGILGELPDGVRVVRRAQTASDVTLWFVRSLADLEAGIERLAEVTGGGRLWICWPKKASGIATDVTQRHVRERGLAAGIVDFKICAIDATWSGLCFTKRKSA
jgi:hypothetical protein